MNNKTMDTMNTLINYFHDIWHLPALWLVNRAWCERTPSALLEALQYTEQAITALEHWNAAVEHLVQMNGDTQGNIRLPIFVPVNPTWPVLCSKVKFIRLQLMTY